jgi:hypothetical protein
VALAASIARLSDGVMKRPLPTIRLRSPSPSDAAPKSGASGPNIVSNSSLAWTMLGSGWCPPKSSSGTPLRTCRRKAQPLFQDFHGIGAGHRVHGVKRHGQAIGHGARIAAKSNSAPSGRHSRPPDRSP